MGEVKGKRKMFSDDAPSKRFKDSGVGSSYEESQRLYSHAGTINKVVLVNFMCHDKLEINFSPGVNFITGRNGTGKSAILTALVVGLGGKASDTNRAGSLKEFVKSNESFALIKVVINNRGYNAFQSDKYGNEIIVQRTIGITSSQYKIMSSDGTVVSTKHDDLVRMLMYLNLQVDNPVALLTQDTARNFLHNTKPSDKYLFFLKATRLEYIQSIYNRVQISIGATRASQEHRVKRLERLKEVKNALEKRLKNLQSVEQTRDRLEVVENELCWAKVKQLELQLEKMEAAETEQGNVSSQANDEIDKWEEKVKIIAVKIKESENGSESLVDAGKACSTKCADLKRASEKLNNLRKVKQDEIVSRRDDVSRLKNNIESINKQVKDLEAALIQATPKNKSEIENSLKTLLDEKEKIDALLKTHQHHLNQLEAALQSDVESLQSLDVELAGINQKIGQFKTTINTLENKEEGTVKLFGPYVVQLNKEIQVAYEKGLFSKMPRGPMGSFIKVKDKSWAPAVESIIGSDNLRSYLVNNHQDRKVLYSLISKVIGKNNWPIPSVTATKFLDEIYDYSRNAVDCPGHSSVLDMLEVSDFVVTNCLIDILSIETTLLVESPRAAREMMQDEKNVPRNCKKVVTKTGDSYYPDPNYRSYCGDGRTEAKFLQTNVEDAKRGMLTEMSHCKKWAASTNSQKLEVGKRIKLHKREIQSTKTLLDQNRKRKLAIKQKMSDLQQLDTPDASQIEFWIKERVTLEKELENVEEIINQAKQECDSMHENYKEIAKQYNSLREEAKAKSRDIENAAAKSHQLNNKLMAAELNLDSAKKKKLEAHKILANLQSQVRNQKEMVEKGISGALKLTLQRIETDRQIGDINEEIRNLKNKIERVEQSEGNPKELGESFNNLKNECDVLSKEIIVLDTCIKKMKFMLKHRREIYSKCLQLLVTRMQMVFQSLIDRRRFQGGIEVDHGEQKLDIKVTLRNPSPNKSTKTGAKRTAESGDPKSLSGGERSFSTVAFILSLWDAVELPFYALDEFDVFMDNANREMTLDLLMNHSKEKKDFQFVFLTPQAVSSITENDDVTIFSLQAHEAQRNALC